MATAIDLSDLRGVKHFDTTGDAATVSLRWTSWLEEFEAYADSKGLFVDNESDTNQAQRRALLLYSAGAPLRDTFKTLQNTGTVKEYFAAVHALNSHYVVKPNVTFQRHMFRKTVQGDETIAQYVTRLRTASDGCEYGTDTDNQIRDQVVEYCKSDQLRKKFLEKGETLTLENVLKIATTFESVESQFKDMKITETPVNRVEHRKQKDYNTRHKQDKTNMKSECYRCGGTDHYGRDTCCPARGKQCQKCKGWNHFASKCKTKRDSQTRKPGKKRNSHRNGNGLKTFQKVNHLEADSESENDYAFNVKEKPEKVIRDKIPVKLGGVKINIIVDSGSDCNIVDREMWESLKANKIKCTSKKCSKKLFPYTSSTPLKTIGSFCAEIEAGNNSTQAEFVVIDCKGEALLGKATAMQLGVLKIGLNVNVVNQTLKETVMQKHSKLFTGIGKLQGRQVKLSVDPNVKPVAQPLRRVPFGLRGKVEAKISELIDKDIIEAVEEPTPWVNPVVVVPKPNGEIRLCLDMRRSNEAIQRERHPIPTVDEVLQDMSQSRVFSKLDLRWGYHQLELHPESRNITTFVTHCGLYRYKRLLFGINAAPEIYQHEINKIVQGIPGVANISDDIVVHSPNMEQHMEQLEQVFQRLEAANLTLNPDKCLFGLSKITFMGHELTDQGINLSEDKVQAVKNAREPENASEVRSFLGLVNFCSRFIPDFSTLAEPLRRLTRQSEHFVFGPEQKSAFQKLKDCLSSSETLGYFDINAKTKVISDASPVGLGAVLVQEQNDQQRVISYASRSLSDVERRYSQTEKEALGLVWACEKFHPYIYGIKFELLTDHKPLEAIYSPKSKPCARIERWVLRLQPYEFKVVYIPGKSNIADPLSRLSCDKARKSVKTESKDAEDYVRFVALNATPPAMTARDIELESATDDELTEIRHCIDSGKWDNCTQKQFVIVSGELCKIGKLVMRGTRIVVPKKLRPQVLSLAHEGHLGVVGTKQNLRSRVWWPGLERDAEKFCKTCHGCQLVSRPNPPEPIRSTSLPSKPWEDLAIDFLGPLPSGESILVVIDYYSRYYELEIMKSTTAEKTVNALKRIFARHGLPVSISSDNGPQFVSETFENYMKEMGIDHHKVTPRWPQANGEVERQNQSLEKRMKISHAQGGDWKSGLLDYVTAYRATPHSTTGKSPAELLFGRKIRTKLPEITSNFVDQDVRDRDCEMKGMAKLYADKKRRAVESDLIPGDSVLVRKEQPGKLDTPYLPKPFQIVSKAGSKVTVESPEGVRYDRNSSHVKRYHPPPMASDCERSNGTIGQQPPESVEKPMDSPVSARPERMKSVPKKYQDFVMK